MFAKIGLLLLAFWLVGFLWLPMIGEAVHVLLLVGLMLTLIGFLKAREAASAAVRSSNAIPRGSQER